MNTFDDDTLLTERLHRIGATAPVPRPDPFEDVRRGRRRVLRARLVATAGTVLAVGIIGIAGVALRPVVADRATDPAGSPTATSTSSVREAESVAQALPSTFDLAINLISERDAVSAGVPDVVLKPLHLATDEAIATWTTKADQIDAGGNQELADVLSRTQRSLDGIAGMRSDIGDTAETRVEGEEAYTALVHDLLAISTLVPPIGDAEIDAETEALGSVQPTVEALFEQRAIMTNALAEHEVRTRGGEQAEPIGKDDLASLAAAEATWRQSLADFYTSSSDRQRETLDQITKGTATEGASGVPAQQVVGLALSTGSLDGVTIEPDEYVASCVELIRALHELFVDAANELIGDLAKAD